MKIRRVAGISLWIVILLLNMGVSRCAPARKPAPVGGGQSEPGHSKPGATDGTRLITFLQTNDMHGNLEASVNKDGSRTGGMAFFGGVVRSIRQGLRDQLGDQAGVLLVDAGDQFQGTLLSNYNEGELVFSAMSDAGYDAAIPGNHDYDFGPLGWLQDTTTAADQDPRGAIKKLAALARFPLLSANTYLADSIVDADGNKVAVDNIGCKPKTGTPLINWSQARRPDFLRPYLVKNVAGVRVALIGIDSARTSEVTAISNIQDLCFASEAETFVRIRDEIGSQADVFVMILHDGNTPTDRKGGAIKVAEQLTPAGKAPLVDAIIAGHTHTVQDDIVNGVPIIQSGSSVKMFGRLDLVWDPRIGALDRSRTRIYAGVSLMHENCDPKAVTFCKADGATKTIRYEGRVVTADPVINDLIDAGKRAVAPISDRKLGFAAQKLWVDRTKESPLADALTDSLKQLSGADIAFMNTGGIREPMAPGAFTYTDLFSVLPFNNRAVMVGPMKTDKLLALLLRSAKTCGQYGALMQSGLKVTFEKLCKKDMPTDEQTRLLHVETLGGEVILDVKKGILAEASRTFSVATLDYLSGGGSGYSDFVGVPLVGDLGILREKLTDYLLSQAGQNGRLTEFSGVIDGRWTEQARPETPSSGGEVVN